MREPPKREREQQRDEKEKCRRETGFEPVPVGLPGRILAARIHAAAVEPEKAFEEPGRSDDRQPESADPRKPAGPERAPEAQREGDDQKSVEVRCDLVIEPGLVGRLRAEIADVVVGRTKRLGLGEVAEQDAGYEASPALAVRRSRRRGAASCELSQATRKIGSRGKSGATAARRAKERRMGSPERSAARPGMAFNA